jgi:predicted nucleotidyltransferase
MIDKAILNTIKTTVKSYLPEAKVLLFGSRARGNYNSASDFDVLVVTSETYSERIKSKWRIKIHGDLVDAFRIPFDILINSEKEIEAKRKLTGHVIRSAMKEAIEL